jgi:hypothetical protein
VEGATYALLAQVWRQAVSVGWQSTGGGGRPSEKFRFWYLKRVDLRTGTVEGAGAHGVVHAELKLSRAFIDDAVIGLGGCVGGRD